MNRVNSMLRKLFGGRTRWRIVEVEKPRPLAELDDEGRKSVRALGAHPGFIYLLAKLRLQRHALEERLRNSRHAKIQDVEFIQSGIHWCDWLASQLHRAVMESDKPAQPAMPPETEAFEEMRRLIEAVGADKVPGATSSES